MATASISSHRARPGGRWGWFAAGAVTVAAVAAATWGFGGPQVRGWLLGAPKSDGTAAHDDAHENEDEHEHAVSADVLELSPQAVANLNVQLATIDLRAYERVISIPGIVIEEPGKSRLEITAPLTGVVTKISAHQGDAVEPGQLLFQLRLSHEELVQAQADFLRTAEELDVIGREVARLETLADQGTIAGKTLLERRYEQQKAEAMIRAQRQALILHGFSEEQVNDIQRTRTLLQFLDVVAPSAEMTDGAATPPRYQVQQLAIERGQHVNAGDALADLADHQTLLIEGMAFERDIPSIHELSKRGWKISAVIDQESGQSQVIEGLELAFLNAQVDPESRAFHFYARLPNELLSASSNGDMNRSLTWRYKPGQRVQLRVPVENLPDRIVLPAAAVAKDGVETYVFQQNGKAFQRRPVHVEVEDPQSVVIANDGSLFPGDQVATNGAQQMLLALKNKSGGAIDPHAGHNH